MDFLFKNIKGLILNFNLQPLPLRPKTDHFYNKN